VLLAAAVAMASGCATRRRTTGGLDGDVIDPNTLPGNEFPDRVDIGGKRPITDVSFENVLFEYDSFLVRDSEKSKIRAVADYLTQNGGVDLVVDGHCDERGSAEYNQALGEHRALAVRSQVIGMGIDGMRVQTRSFGEDQPENSAHSPEAWRANRRAVFALYR
jgi:peptidoglycan-associated lipoprotein